MAELRKKEPWWPTCSATDKACNDPASMIFVQSENWQNWESRYPVGSIIGFTAWGLFFAVTVVLIFYDMYQKYKEYKDMVEDDVSVLRTTLGVSENRWDDIQKELETRLRGGIKEEGGDDQLLGEAMKLTKAEYEKNLEK